MEKELDEPCVLKTAIFQEVFSGSCAHNPWHGKGRVQYVAMDGY